MPSTPRPSDKQILHERALRLAPTKALVETGKQVEIIICLLGGDLFGFETTKVKEIARLKNVSIMPGVPKYYIGITNVRGQIVPVMDLKIYFNPASICAPIFNKVLIVQSKDITLGLLADEVLNTRLVPLSAIQTASSVLPEHSAAYLRGVTTDGIAIVDMEKILLDERILVNHETK